MRKPPCPGKGQLRSDGHQLTINCSHQMTTTLTIISPPVYSIDKHGRFTPIGEGGRDISLTHKPSLPHSLSLEGGVHT